VKKGVTMNFLARPETLISAGIVGVIVGLIGVTVPSRVYIGTRGQKYSFLNHYISELGEIGVSRFAWVFNLGMILAGICTVIVSLSLGLMLTGFWAKAGLVFGVATGISLSLVGVFPMSNMKPHVLAATAFFRSGLLMFLFFSLAIVLQAGKNPVVPRATGLVGIIPVLSFGVFLGLMWPMRNQNREPLDAAGLNRPRAWKLCISEWSIFFAFIFWILVIAVVI